ncbi:HlyD family efflux transporter periplasmic adaptor subunit [Massilia sp. R2A-15]|uniref:HlyD family secretion protein n=1 Tax=Massilia sp. R2A-15 TaxID=3064278 RepID=UPI002734958B|nr:HlyD family efflux transporter periplasmic adaptor subunit [Massilia sp. R2A-15]WLI90246.1 HlyD family efflux transporter periplasmic adaptor subunit [Massilia sp. R2A-15]
MASGQSVFRAEVLDSDGKRAFGDVLLVYPVSNYFIVALATALLTALCSFAYVGKYTRHASISGVLEPSEGVVKLYAPQGGTLKTLRVQEGQQVRKGQVLLIFESEHVGADGKAIEVGLDAKLTEQLAALRQELGGTAKLHVASVATMRRDLDAAQRNRATLRSETQTQAARVKSAERMVARFKSLQKSGFMPAMQTQQKIDELMDQQMRLQGLQKQATSADADIARLTLELENSPLREQVAEAQLSRSISTTESELSKQQNNHEWSVLAPCDGAVSSLTISHHQNAAIGVPLVTVVPSNSKLQAILYAPSRALGFLKPGQAVKLKLDAFPYQKFGVAEGKVMSIADSPVRASESSAGTRLATSTETGEPMYTVRVQLDKQLIDAYGSQQRLRPGMQLDAEVQLDTRRIYEWVLEPLYSLRRG